MSQYSEEIVYKCERYYLIDSKDEFKRAEEAAEITQLILDLNDGELIKELKNRIFHNKSTRCIQNEIFNEILKKNNL